MNAWGGFLRSYGVLTRELDAELRAAHGLPLTWYDALVWLYDAPGRRMRMTELSELVILSPSGATRLIDRMVAAGLVRRERCPSDKRGYFAVMTGAGAALLRRARPTHRAGIRRLFVAKLDPESLEQLAAAWRRLGGD